MYSGQKIGDSNWTLIGNADHPPGYLLNVDSFRQITTHWYATEDEAKKAKDKLNLSGMSSGPGGLYGATAKIEPTPGQGDFSKIEIT